MAANGSLKYVGNAWRSLKSTPNLFGKLLLLAVLQLVPILGQIAAFAYFLGWAREAAWGIETPLPAHLFGRDDKDYWPRGAKAFAAHLLYGLIVAAIAFLITGVYLAVPHFVAISDSAYAVLEAVVGILITLLSLYFVGLETVGLLRLAIYNRFGAAFQWGFCSRMLFRHLGGLLKIGLAVLGIYLLLSIPMLLVVAALFPSALSVAVSWGVAFMGMFDGSLSESALSAILAAGSSSYLIASAGSLVVGLLVSVVGYIYEALMWRSLGNWLARFDVPAWGGRFDPLPSSLRSLPSHAQPQTAAPAQAEAASEESAAPSAPQKRCHPILVTLLSLFFSAAVAVAASWGSLAVVDAMLADKAVSSEVEEFVIELADEFVADLELETGDEDLFESGTDLLEELGITFK